MYHDIWKLGVNTALRISDLLQLTMADVKKLDPSAPALELVEPTDEQVQLLALYQEVLLELLKPRALYT